MLDAMLRVSMTCCCHSEGGLYSRLVFFFIVPATTEIYTLSYTTLFRSYSIFPERSRLVRAACNCARPSAAISTRGDRKSTRLNSSHVAISYAVFCLKKKNPYNNEPTKTTRPNQLNTPYPSRDTTLRLTQ